MQRTWTLIGALLMFTLLACGQAFAQDTETEQAALAAEQNPAQADLGLSLGMSARDIRLEDILSGVHQVSLSPIVGNEFSLDVRGQEKYWLRMKVVLPVKNPALLLSFERQGVRSIKLYEVAKNDKKTLVVPLQSSQAPHLDKTRGRWPTRFVFQLPGTISDGAVLYAEIETSAYAHLQPMLLNTEQQQALINTNDSFFTKLYLAILIFICLSMYRQLRVAESQAILISLSLIIGLFSFFAYNEHLVLFLKTELVEKPSFAYALMILTAAPFLSASSHFSGFHARWSDGFVWLIRFAIALMVFAIFIALSSYFTLNQLQLMTSIIWTICLAVAMSIYLFDVRASRWAGFIVAIALLAALWAPSCVYLQSLPSTRMNLYGFQVFFLILMAVYLLLPWLRSALQERGRKRRIIPVQELSTDEQVANARTQLMEGLQSALENASESDVEWIAYRRLLEGLKPVLPQIASAVIAKNYHNEDLLLVEPKSATERYAALINQRGNLLKNLSRMSAPQQIRIDFDGPDGPLQAVSLAVIPLPIDKPGWGALIIERHSDHTYSETEMDLGTEFAALATTAGDEAAEAMHARHNKEMDAETGICTRRKFDEIVKRLLDAANLQNKPLSLLLVAIDNFSETVLNKPELKTEILQSLVSVMSDEVDYGVTIARFDAEDIIVLMPDKNIGEAREQAQRLCNIANRIKAASFPTSTFTLSVGVSHLQPGERNSQMMIERTAAALAKARQYGGNQIQAVSSSTL